MNEKINIEELETMPPEEADLEGLDEEANPAEDIGPEGKLSMSVEED